MNSIETEKMIELKYLPSDWVYYFDNWEKHFIILERKVKTVLRDVILYAVSTLAVFSSFK